MNLSLHDPFTLAQDTPETRITSLRSGHTVVLRFNRKGDYLAAGRTDGKIIIWDMETMGVAMKLKGHWKQIQSLSWSRCGRYLLSASQDTRVSLWDLKTQQRIRTVKFEAPIYYAELHPHDHNLFVASLFEEDPFLVDITNSIAQKHRLSSKPIDVDDISESQTTCSIFTINGRHIITGTNKGYINIIETNSRTVVYSTKLCGGIVISLRLTSNGRQMLVNSQDRIIRVVDMPDMNSIALLSELENPDHEPPNNHTNPDDPSSHSALSDPSTIHLHTTHKFQDLVNRLRWNDCSFSHTTSSLPSQPANIPSHLVEYVTASTYMRKDIYIWHLPTSSLQSILESREETSWVEWHPSRPMLACASLETGCIVIYGPEIKQKWSALAPDFMEVTENVEYVEREDEFDCLPHEEKGRRRREGEDEMVDVLGNGGNMIVGADDGDGVTDEPSNGIENNGRGKIEEPSFVLPMLYAISDSEDEDQRLIKLGAGTMRKKDVNEGTGYESDGNTPSQVGASGLSSVGANRRKKKY